MNPTSEGVGPPSGQAEWRRRSRIGEAASSADQAQGIAGIESLAREVLMIRRSMEERFRALNHRIEALDTDLLRLVTLVRTAVERDGEPPRNGLSAGRPSIP